MHKSVDFRANNQFDYFVDNNKTITGSGVIMFPPSKDAPNLNIMDSKANDNENAQPDSPLTKLLKRGDMPPSSESPTESALLKTR